MNVNNIIKLDNNKEYLLLDDSLFEGNRYFLATEIDKDDKPSDNHLFFKCINDGGEEYVEVVNDDKLKTALLGVFTINYSDMTEEDKK